MAYIDEDELKEILSVAGETYADAAIEIAVPAANQMIDGYMGTSFEPGEPQARIYEASPFDTELWIDDCGNLAAVAVDRDGDGTFEEAWVEGTNYITHPANAVITSVPINRIEVLVGTRFPRHRRSVEVTGEFGWAAIPAGVREAAVLLANRFLTRMRAAPLGILVAEAENAVAMARLGRIDPDAAALLGNLPGREQPTLRTVQLG